MLWSNALRLILLVGILGEATTNRLPQFSQEKRAKSIDEQQPIGKTTISFIFLFFKIHLAFKSIFHTSVNI